MRNKRIEIRVDKKEYEDISLKASDYGYKTVSDYVRTLCIGKENVRTLCTDNTPIPKPVKDEKLHESAVSVDVIPENPRKTPIKGHSLSFLD